MQTKDTLPASTTRFFKIITTTILQDGKLRIPKGFTRKHSKDMTNQMFLKTPDEKKWEIHSTKNDGYILFEKGWKEFATHYSLDHGYMIMFQYEENSHFGVHVFDNTTLEIEYPCNENYQNDQNGDDVVILDKPPSCKKKTRPKSQISCSQPYKKLRSDISEGFGTCSKFQNLPKNHHVQSSDDMDGNTKGKKVNQVQELKQLTFEKNEALNRAQSFKSKNPTFTVVMGPSYLYNYYLHVPKEFAKNNLKKEQSNIQLQHLDGRSWDAKYCFGQIKVGWKKFVRDNKLKVGDVCVFELIKNQSLTLKVLIFRSEEKPHSSLPQELVQRKRYISDFKSEIIVTNKGVMMEAKKFNSKYPFFKVNIRQRIHTHGRWGRHVPYSFVKSYLECKEQNVMLKIGKKLWHVKLLCYPHLKSSELSRGWSIFWEENKLKVGDVCVFELIKTENVVFHVHIFRGN